MRVPPAAGAIRCAPRLPRRRGRPRPSPLELGLSVEHTSTAYTDDGRGWLSPYYSEFMHDANNSRFRSRACYALRLRIEPPGLRRHGEKEEGPALAEGADVEFAPRVRLEPEEG
jgi:hypothetical protein